jgi:hypothetical protein
VSAPNAEPDPDSGVDELHADIEATREQLGETIAALADKADVKGRAEQKVAETTAAVKDRGEALAANARARPAIPIGAIVAVGAVAIAVIVIRRRR